jgi:hypothetical protein
MLAAVLLLAASALAANVELITPGAARADTAQPGCSTRDPFTPALASQLAARWPANRFTAEVYDERTGCQYDLHPGLRLTTASVLKVEVMSGILLRAQSQGRPLSAQEDSLIFPMITASHDAPTTQLWQSLGGAAGMTSLDNVFGMTGTTQVGPEWGVTVTTAADQVHLLRQVVLGDFGPIGPAYRADAFYYMSHVIASQRWGIGAGLPSGWSFVNKNGFAGSVCCAWRINSTGVVYDPSGRGAYAIAILSDGWPDQPSGVAAVETISRAVSASLANGAPQKATVARNSDGTLQVFAATASGRVLTDRQSGPSQPFGGWQDLALPARAAGAVGIGTGPGGALQVFVHTTDNRLLTAWEPGPSQGFGGWLDMGLDGQISSDASVATAPNAAMQVLVAGTGGRVLTTWQSLPGHPFGGWLDLGLPRPEAGVPVVGSQPGGALEVFARSTDNRLLTSWQPAAGQPFGGWLDMGLDGQIASDPSAGLNTSGALQVFVQGRGGRVVTSWQVGAHQPFGGWLDLGLPGQAVGVPAVGSGPSGALEVFTRTSDNRLLTSWQSAASQPLGGWLDMGLDGQILSEPAVGTQSNGAMEVFVRGPAGSTLSSWQVGANRPFGGWLSLEMPT